MRGSGSFEINAVLGSSRPLDVVQAKPYVQVVYINFWLSSPLAHQLGSSYHLSGR